MKCGKRYGVMAMVAALVLLGGMSVAGAQDGRPAEPIEDGQTPAEAWCARSIGDLNGDGIADYAVSTRAGIYPRMAYIVTGGEFDRSEFDPAKFAQDPDVIVIRGAAAAAFQCIPEFAEPTAPMSRFRTMQVLPAPDASPIGRPTHYTLVILDPGQPYPSGYPSANGINAKGHVVGELNGRAVLFDRTELRSLGTLGGDRSEAFDINNFGDIVGVSLTGQSDEFGLVSMPFIHDGFQMEAIRVPLGGAANKINDSDQIVGGMWIEGEWYRPYRAFLHQAGLTRDLGTLGGIHSEAHSINAAGVVVGESETFVAGTNQPSTRAFMYRNGIMKDLGALGHTCYDSDEDGYVTCYEQSVATDINDKAQITGFSTTDEGWTHAFLIERGVMKDLGTLGGHFSWAYAINNSGQIVGASYAADDSYAPFIYDQGTMYNLLELIVNLPEEPITAYQARDINDFGQIAGSNFILDPIYEAARPGEEFSFVETLGRILRFEYWVSASEQIDSSCRKTLAGVQVNIETMQNDKKPSDHRKYKSHWFAAGQNVHSKQWDSKWRQAFIVLPRELRGKNATIRIRVRQSDPDCEPVVYMRRFTMGS